MMGLLGGWRLGTKYYGAWLILWMTLVFGPTAVAKGIHHIKILNDAEDFLPVDRAFVFNAQVQKNQIWLHWHIAPGYYLYQSRMQVYLQRPDNQDLRQLNWQPQTQVQQQKDPNYGNVRVFKHEVSLRHLLPVSAEHHQAPMQLFVKYQGCVNAGLCYPVQWRKLLIQGAKLEVVHAAPVSL